MYIRELTNDRQSANLSDEYFIISGTRNSIVKDKSTLALIIDEPCLNSCEYLYDCNILTLNSSANKNDIATGPFIIIDYSSLSDENKLIAKRLEEEGKIKYGKDENGIISTCEITFPISYDSTVKEVDNLFKKIASEFKKQDILYGYYTEEELDNMILSDLEKNQGYIEYNNFYMKYYDYLLVRISEGKLKGAADGECEIDGNLYRLSDVLENIKKSDFVQSQYTYDSKEGKYWLHSSLRDKHIKYLNDKKAMGRLDLSKNLERIISYSKKGEYNKVLKSAFSKFSYDDQIAILYIFLHTQANEDGNAWNKRLKNNSELKDYIFELIGLPEKIFENSHSKNTKLMMIDNYLDILFYTNNNYPKNYVMDVIVYYANNLLDGDIEKQSSIICSILNNINRFDEDDRESIKTNLDKILSMYIEKTENSTLLTGKVLSTLIESNALFKSLGIDSVNNALEQIRSKKINCESNDISNVLLISRLNKGCLSLDEIDLIMSNDVFPQDMRNKATVDYLRLLLLKNYGIEKAIIADDKAVKSSCSIFKMVLGCRRFDKDTSPFHESIHSVQFFNIHTQQVFEGNRYYMLKDMIICENIPYQIYEENYQENGTSSWLFEKEAIVLGRSLEYSFKNRYNLLSTEEQQNLLNKMNEPIQVLDYFVMNGEYIDKLDFFDKLLLSNPKLIEKYPILEVEYNRDGTKKDEKEIADALDKRVSITHNKKERQDIYDCIFTRKYEIGYSGETPKLPYK